MTGRFVLHYCSYGEQVRFGNLSEDRFGTLGSIINCVREDNRTPVLIAHDVVEHTIAHRTNVGITYEDEMQAIGAIQAVRNNEGFDLWSELLSQAADVCRDLKPISKIALQHLINIDELDANIMRHLIDYGIEPSQARIAMHHFCLGYVRKSKQFKGCAYTSSNAFKFVERAAKEALKMLYHEDGYCSGIAVYFDTALNIPRFQMKRA